MQRPTANDFDHASLEAMMERYRAELLRYQRATPPGKPTLAQNYETSERGRSTQTVITDHSSTAQLNTEVVQVRPAQKKAESTPAAQPALENKKAAAQPETRREKLIVDTPPIMLPALTPRFDTAIQREQETTIILPQTAFQEAVPQPTAPALSPNPATRQPTAPALSPNPATRQQTATAVLPNPATRQPTAPAVSPDPATRQLTAPAVLPNPATPQPTESALSPTPAASQPAAPSVSPIPAAPQPPVNAALEGTAVNPVQRSASAQWQSQPQPLNTAVASSRQPLSPQEIAQVPKLAGAPIPQSVIDSITGPELQNSVPLPQPAVNRIAGPTLQNSTTFPQPAVNSGAAPIPQSSGGFPQPAINSSAQPAPQNSVVIPQPFNEPPNVAALAAQSRPMPRTPNIQPEQAPAPTKNERAVAPVETSEPGCIAHTEFEKGTGAYGVFRPYERMGKYTLASFLQTPGEAVQTLVRFAADAPTGSADAIRCRRSFTVKFFCREGEYDLFGMHLPVSVGTTEKTLSDCCAASRADPKTGLRTRSAFWEFLVTHREALHATLWLYSDLGTIGSYRTIDGYGLPCLWVNAKNERRAVRPRWLSRQRPQTLTRFEAEELAGSDPDAVARDLAQSLQSGERPQYELSIQVIEPEQFATLPFDPFDPTALWPAEQFKPQRIGLLTLERLPDDVLAELDITRFGPENIIPGIEHVPAPVIKGGDNFTQVRQYLRSLGEFSRHRLIDNLSEELLRLPPLLLEQVLILFSQADLEFGQAMTLALGG